MNPELDCGAKTHSEIRRGRPGFRFAQPGLRLLAPLLPHLLPGIRNAQHVGRARSAERHADRLSNVADLPRYDAVIGVEGQS